MPQFKGGLDAFYKYIFNSIRYPDIDRKNNVQGRVIVTFVVNADGKTDNVRVFKGSKRNAGRIS